MYIHNFFKEKKTPDKISLNINGCKLNFEINPCFLGITFDRNLSGIPNLKSVKEMANKRLDIPRVLSYKKQWHLNPPTMISIYKQLIRTLFDQGASFSLITTSSQIKLIEPIQNTALRIIYKIN